MWGRTAQHNTVGLTWDEGWRCWGITACHLTTSIHTAFGPGQHKRWPLLLTTSDELPKPTALPTS